MSNIKKIKTYPFSARKNLVKIDDFSQVIENSFSIKPFINSLPKIHAGNIVRKIIESIVRARKNNRPFILGMGAHVIKCGLAPYLIQMIRKGIITLIALNGAGSIHDFELAAFGETSEDVAAELKAGRFGCVEETGAWMSEAIKEGYKQGLGWGQALYNYMKNFPDKFPNKEISILYNCGKYNVPCTVHVAFGTDFIHLHPKFDGASAGFATFRDFEIFCEQVEQLEKGVYWNLGSAVILPEVFLKAVSRAHNLGYELNGMITINTDQIMHYRPMTNVVKRPSIGVGEGYSLTCHHEILVPLISLAVLEELS